MRFCVFLLQIVVVTVRLPSQRLLRTMYRTIHVLQLSKKDVAAYTTYVLQPIACSVHCTGRFMCDDYQT